MNVTFASIDLLIQAPGLPRGVEFERQAVPRMTSSAPRADGVIDLRDILAQDDIIFDDDDDVAENEAVSDVVGKESENEATQAVEQAAGFDDVIKV